MIRPLLALLLAASPALALDSIKCHFDRHREGYGTMPVETILPMPDEVGDIWLRSYRGQPTDMGNGMVATDYAEDSLLRGEQGTYFDHCPSGTGFRVVTWRREGDRETSLGQDAGRVVHDAMASEQAFTMAEIAALLGSDDAYRLEMESCGCAAYYPEMRGDRLPYEPNGLNH
jgi:hypothetical protein